MDQIMVNIEWETGLQRRRVVLLGAAGDETITCEEVAGWAGTIPYAGADQHQHRVPRLSCLGNATARPGLPRVNVWAGCTAA